MIYQHFFYLRIARMARSIFSLILLKYQKKTMEGLLKIQKNYLSVPHAGELSFSSEGESISENNERSVLGGFDDSIIQILEEQNKSSQKILNNPIFIKQGPANDEENSFDQFFKKFEKQSKVSSPWKPQNAEKIMKTLHQLLDLYIKEEILKHYCQKIKWRFPDRLIKSLAFPVFDMLQIPKQKLPFMFESLLPNVTSIFLLHTDTDSYSRLESSDLLIQMAKTWAEVGKTEVTLKKYLSEDLERFRIFFYDLNSERQIFFNQKKFQKYIFAHSKKHRDSTVLEELKTFVFYQKFTGKRILPEQHQDEIKASTKSKSCLALFEEEINHSFIIEERRSKKDAIQSTQQFTVAPRKFKQENLTNSEDQKLLGNQPKIRFHLPKQLKDKNKQKLSQTFDMSSTNKMHLDEKKTQQKTSNSFLKRNESQVDYLQPRKKCLRMPRTYTSG